MGITDRESILREALEKYFEEIKKDAARSDRLLYLLDKYGEACKYTDAGKIIGCSRYTVMNMLEDGRLEYACAGTRVSVRSIARYLDAPRAENFKAYQRRRGRKWVVTRSDAG